MFSSIIILLTFQFLVFAQEADTSIIISKDTVRVIAEKHLKIPEINSIASKMSLSLHKTPASIGVVSSMVLKEQNATILSDALRNISGINVQSNIGTHDYYLIRGFESTNTGLVLTDGAMVPDLSMFKIYGFGFYDLYNVDQVEVLKGPASFLYGANTLSGAVNLVRKAPIPRNFANVSFNTGKYNTRRGTVDIGVMNEKEDVSFRLNGLLQYNEQYRKEKYHKGFAFNPAITWNIDKNTFVNFNFEYINNFSIPDVGLPLYKPEKKWRLPDLPLDMSFQTPLDFSKQEIFRLHFKYEKDTKNAVTIRSKIYFNHLNGNIDITIPHFPHINSLGVWVVERHMYMFNEKQKVFGNQNEALFTFSTGSFNHKLLIGFEASFLNNSSIKALSNIPDTYLFNHSELVKNYNDVLKLKEIKSNAETFLLAPYLINHISFSEQLQLLYGGRYDIINFKVDRRNAPFNFFNMVLTSVPERFTQTYQKFSPMVGLIIQESENLWFYANAGNSFSQGVRITDEPIVSSQFEAGYKYRSSDGKIRNSLAIYSLLKENIAIPLQAPLQGNKHSFSGSQRSRGLEFEIATQPYENWFLFFTYAYTLADLIKYNALHINDYIDTKLGDFSDNTPAFVPAHLLNIWSTYKLPIGLGIGGGIKYVGKQYLYVDNGYEISGYFTFDATLFYESEKWGCRLNIKNLSDTLYFTRGFGPYSIIPNQSNIVFGTINFSI
ncbi:TonB-dependent receptor [Calditrichota bacterium]